MPVVADPIPVASLGNVLDCTHVTLSIAVNRAVVALPTHV